MDRNMKFWFDGKDSEQMGIKLQNPVAVSGATPRLERVSVPGRNGDIIYSDGSYENRACIASCFAIKKHNVMQSITRVNNWLLHAYDYRELVIPEDKDHFFLAVVDNGAEINTRLSMLAPFDINFSCRPERFLRTGKDVISLKDGKINNPTVYPAKPLIRIVSGGGSIGEVDILFNNFKIYAEDIQYEEFWIDTEKMNAYIGNVNLNNLMYISTDLVLKPGVTDVVNLCPNVDRIEIIPRWWEL